MTPEQPVQTAPTEIVQRSRQSTEILKMLLADTSGNYRHLVEELVRTNNEKELFDQDWRMAKQFALSGDFADITGQTQEQAIAKALSKIAMGRNWGMLAADAMANVFFINGKPGVGTDYLASKIQQAGYSWDAQWHEETVEYKKGKTWEKCIGCTLWLKSYNRLTNRWEPVVDRDGKPVKASFTEADAENAMIYEKEQGQQRAGQKPLAEKWNYKSWGRDMYFWSAMRRLRKYYLTGILRGAIQVELADYDVPIEAAAPQPTLAEPAQPEPPKKSLRDFVLESEQQPGLLEE
jgi:hypothetical protein